MLQHITVPFLYVSHVVKHSIKKIPLSDIKGTSLGQHSSMTSCLAQNSMNPLLERVTIPLSSYSCGGRGVCVAAS